MKQNSKNIGLLALVVAISIGSTYALTSQFSAESFGTPSPASGAFMSGHVIAVVTDDGGNIIAYRQADNAIVISGMNVIARQVFGDAVANFTNNTSGPVNWMNIGNNTGGAAPAAADANLACPLQFATQGRCGVSVGQENSARPLCVGILATMGSSDGRVNPSGSAQINVTAVATFDGTECSSIAIQEAAMWNNATSAAGDIGEMFARNVFGAVTLTTTDSLELTWRFTFTDN